MIAAVLGQQGVPRDLQINDHGNQHAVMKVLVRQFKELSTSPEAPVEQHLRKDWLNGYHALLKSLPSSTEGAPVADRLAMVESSVVLQMEEFQITRQRMLDVCVPCLC